MIEFLLKSLTIGALTYGIVWSVAKRYPKLTIAVVWLGFALLLTSPWVSLWTPYPATTVPLPAHMGVVISPIESPPHQRSVSTFDHRPVAPGAQMERSGIRTAPIKQVLIGVWCIGAFLMFAILCRRLMRLSNTVQAAKPDGRYRGLPVVVSEATETPFLWCLGKPRIVLPVRSAEWADTTRQHVLAHEYHHWKRRDGWNLLAANVVYALLWWHPFVRALVLANEDLVEEACDDAVVHGGIDRAEYADTLLACAHQRRNTVVAGFGGPQRIKHRIKRLLVPDTRSMLLSGGIALAALPALAAAVSVNVNVLEDPAELILRPAPVSVMSSMRHEGPPAGTIQVVLFYDGAPTTGSFFDIEIVSATTGAGFWSRTTQLPKFDTEVPMWELRVAAGYKPSGRVRVGGLVKDGYVDGLAYGVVWRDHDRDYYLFRSSTPEPVDYPNAVCHWPLGFVPTGAESGFFSEDELWQTNSIRHVICGAELVQAG
ncbi:MAG: M56 family metallopeptidase, partial [Pseudomonadota bacterium]